MARLIDDGAQPSGKAPVVPVVAASKRVIPWAKILPWVAVAALAALLLVLIAGILASEFAGSSPGPSPSGAAALGRAFISPLAASLADGFDADADAVEKGATFAEGDEKLKDAFFKTRSAAFDRNAGDALHAIVADGKESTDPETRRRWVEFHRNYAKGLRGGR